jgi:hypothetical protein
MANNSIGTTPIVRISQLREETDSTISGNPANTWFAIVNADIMKTKRLSLDSLLKFIAAYLAPSEVINYFTISTEGGITANNLTSQTVYLGNTITISDTQTLTHAVSSFNRANGAFDFANSAFLKANNALYKAEIGLSRSNAAFIHANSAYDKANSHFVINSGGGVRIDESLQTKNVFFGNTISITDNITYTIAQTANTKAFLPIGINTTSGITGGAVIGLGESLTVSGENIYAHANSAYNYANNSLQNLAINYVSANGTIAYSNNRYILLGTNLELTLQNNPKFNTYISITNMGSSVTNVIRANGVSRIHGLGTTENLRLDVPNITVTMCYIDSVRGWVIV